MIAHNLRFFWVFFFFFFKWIIVFFGRFLLSKERFRVLCFFWDFFFIKKVETNDAVSFEIRYHLICREAVVLIGNPNKNKFLRNNVYGFNDDGFFFNNKRINLTNFVGFFFFRFTYGILIYSNGIPCFGGFLIKIDFFS